jgi:hypothetical protein
VSISLKANAIGGVAVISVLNGNTTMRVIGASCACSVVKGCHDEVSSVTLSPGKGEKAVVAIIEEICYSKEKPIIKGHLIGLSWKDHKLFVDTDDQFVPPTDKLGQVLPDQRGCGSLLVTTIGQTFCYSFGPAAEVHEKELLKQGGRMVKDPGLLCRYFVEQATFEELEAASTGDLRSAEQVRIADLESELPRVIRQAQREIKRCQVQIDEQVSECRRFQTLLEREHNSNEVLRRELSETLRERNEVQAKLDATPGARLKRFWKAVRAWYNRDRSTGTFMR